MKHDTRGSLFLAVPVVFNIAVLLIMPRVLEENHLLPALVIGASALAAPWLLHVFISGPVTSAIERARRERDEAEHADFV